MFPGVPFFFFEEDSLGRPCITDVGAPFFFFAEDSLWWPCITDVQCPRGPFSKHGEMGKWQSCLNRAKVLSPDGPPGNGSPGVVRSGEDAFPISLLQCDLFTKIITILLFRFKTLHIISL